MEFLPFDVIDSIVLLADSEKVTQFEKLEGYWSEAACRDYNQHVDAMLHISPTHDDDNNYALCKWGTVTTFNMLDLEELIAANHCLVIHAVEVTEKPAKSIRYERSTISNSELKKLLLYGYRQPLDLVVHESTTSFTSQQLWKIAQLIENLNMCKIELNYAPEFHQFLVNAFSSQHLLSAIVGEEIPGSLHPHILEWAQRTEFDQMWMDKTPNLKLEFSVFEKLMQRIQRGELGGECFMPLDAYFSEEDCERIRAFLEEVLCWDEGDVSVKLHESGRCQIW